MPLWQATLLVALLAPMASAITRGLSVPWEMLGLYYSIAAGCILILWAVLHWLVVTERSYTRGGHSEGIALWSSILSALTLQIMPEEQGFSFGRFVVFVCYYLLAFKAIERLSPEPNR